MFSSKLAGKVLVSLSLVIVVMTGYQAMSYREQLRLTQQEFEGLPRELLLNLVIATGAAFLGGLQFWGDFQPIRMGDANRPLVLRPLRSEFMTFSKRSEAFASLPYIKSIPALKNLD